MEITYSECFFSFQGEGAHSGRPAVWLRFAGCNLNCNGFGQKEPTKPHTYELPYKEFDETKVTKLEQLPVWTKGCDSSYSWAAKFKHLFHKNTVEEICDKFEALLPGGKFSHPDSGQSMMLCFTGGEPMLQQKAMVAIMEELNKRDNLPGIVTVETNGTRPLGEPLKRFIETYTFAFCEWHWAVSPKLYNVSGELNAIKPQVIGQYYRAGAPTMILKFVCNGTPEAWEELENAVYMIKGPYVGRDVDVWVMPVGATLEDQGKPTVAEIAKETMRRGYNVATRNHVYVFGNQIGT